MSQINVDDVLPLSIVMPGDNTPVNVNGAKTLAKGAGLRSVSIGDNQKATAVGYTMDADFVGVGYGVFPPTYGYTPQTVAIGSLIGDLSSNNTCLQSVLIGSQIARNIDGGYDNVFIGYQSAKDLTGLTSENTCVGTQSGLSLISGWRNTLLGKSAGNNLTTGQNNIVIGYNSTAATATTSNSITLGNSSNNVLRCAVTSITSLSDARDKKDVVELRAGLDFVKGLRPVEFVWDDRDENGKHDINDFGFIAQELKSAQEEAEMADVLKLVYDENPEKLEASYGKLIPILVKAIQELTAKVELLENK
jgi:hypothetical protein